MALDLERVGRLAAELMDTLERDYGDEANELELEDALVVVELRHPDHGTTIRWRGTTSRATVNAGFGALLQAAYTEGEDT